MPKKRRKVRPTYRARYAYLYPLSSHTLLPVEFETFAKDETREIGGDRSPNWMPHKLNMDTRQNEAGHYGDFEKCVAHVWDGGTINMAKYLRGYSDNKEIYENPDVLHWKVWTGSGSNGTVQESYELSFDGRNLENGDILKFQIAPVAKGGSAPLDRLIITVIPEGTKSAYDDWKIENDDKSWLNDLPPVYSSIPEPEAIPNTGEFPGDVSYYEQSPDEGCSWSPWKIPVGYNSYYHPDAYYEIRTDKLEGDIIFATDGPSHQACYDSDRNLIRPKENDHISPGSADRKAAISSGGTTDGHIEADVKPFIWALQLDGNPTIASGDAPTSDTGLPTDNLIYTEISDPVMHEGKETVEYSDRRPAIVDDKVINLGQCPTQ